MSVQLKYIGWLAKLHKMAHRLLLVTHSVSTDCAFIYVPVSFIIKMHPESSSHTRIDIHVGGVLADNYLSGFLLLLSHASVLPMTDAVIGHVLTEDTMHYHGDAES